MKRGDSKKAIYSGTVKGLSSKKSAARVMSALNKCNVCATEPVENKGTCEKCVQKALRLDERQRAALAAQVGVLIPANQAEAPSIIDLATIDQLEDFATFDQDELVASKQGSAGARTLYSAVRYSPGQSARNARAAAVADSLRCFAADQAYVGDVLFLGPDQQSLRPAEVTKILRLA